MKLTPDELSQRLAEVPGWQLADGKWLVRRFAFHSFTAAIQFTNRVAEVAERRNHHPFIAIDYKVVTLRLTTWHAGGLTAEDFAEAAEIDRLFREAEGARMTETTPEPGAG
ncbi:MAG: 4a-hydroxytetrahydrobiopterin dehydratase [Alicyclobacillus sp.]|nr:4a-hydroxytetrahydrobiopterin dehydratase [Alicyclobacillus sp.]